MITNSISTSLMIVLLIQASWIVLFFGLIEHLFFKAIRKERWYDFVAFYTPLLRNIVWILFAISVIYSLASENLPVSLAVAGVILALGWQSIRDFVQGTIFRFQKGDIKGQLLKVKSYSGIVRKMKNTKIELLTDNEEIIQIPYSRIISSITTRPTATKHLKTGSIFVNIPENSLVEVMKPKIRSLLLNMPWVVSGKGVKIEKMPNKQQLKVSFSTPDSKYIERIGALLKEII